MHAATSAWHLVAQRRKGRLDEVGERRGLRARKDAGKEADDERGRGDATVIDDFTIAICAKPFL